MPFSGAQDEVLAVGVAAHRRREDGDVAETHLQFNTAAITSQSFDEGSATFRITAWDGSVVPYASVIDSASSAALYVTGQFPPNTTFAQRATSSIFRNLLRRSN